MHTISLSLNEEEVKLIKKYAQLHSMDLSTFIRTTVLEKIEDEYDLNVFNNISDNEQNDDCVSHVDLKRDLGI